VEEEGGGGTPDLHIDTRLGLEDDEKTKKEQVPYPAYMYMYMYLGR